MARIVSLGSATQDTYLIDRDDFVATPIGSTSIFGKIEIGSKIDIDKVSHEVSGGGINSAISFARWGHESILLTNLGKDSAGETILATLDREGIDTGFISFLPKNTGYSTILIDAKTGNSTILFHHGISTKFNNLSPSVLESINPDWLYISSLFGDMDTLLAFISAAKSQNCKIMFNPSAIDLNQPEKILGILPEIDIIFLNKQEASSLVPGKILSELASHLKNFTETVIITDGAMGGFAANSTESHRFGVYEDVRVKDPLGAGDAFGSGFLAAFASGKSFKSSLVFASANATSVVKQIGTKRGILGSREKLHTMPIQ